MYGSGILDILFSALLRASYAISHIFATRRLHASHIRLKRGVEPSIIAAHESLQPKSFRLSSSAQQEHAQEEQYNAYVSRVARGAGISSFGQGVSRVLGYATQVALARMYGPAALGLYVLASTMILLGNILAQIGMDNGVVRYVAQYRAERDGARIRGTILLALLVSFVLSMVIAGLIFAASGFLANTVFNKPAVEVLFRVFSVSLPFLTVMSMALWAIQGFQTVKYPTYVRQITQPLVNLALIVVFYLLGSQVLGAAIAYVLSMAIGSVFALYYLRRVFPPLLDRQTPPRYEPRALFSASGPMIVANFTQYINSWTAVTVLGVFATAETVGVYHAANRTAALSALVLFAFTGIFSPMISNLYRKGSLEHLGFLYKDVSRWTFTGSLAVFLLTAALYKDVLTVFGEGFLRGWPAMLLIAGAHLFNSSVGLTSRVLAMTGHQKVVMMATLGSTIAGVALNFALVPAYGLYGAAIATSVAIVLANLATLFSVKGILGIWPYTYQYLKPVAAGAVAASATYLGTLALPLPTGAVTILALGPLFMIAFGVLLATMGLTASDRQFLSTFWNSVRRTRRDTQKAPE